VEVLVALTLLSVVVLGAAGFFVHSLRSIQDARTKRIALQVASSQLDRLLAADYEDVVSSTDSAAMVGDFPASVTTEVTERSDGNARYKEVEVTLGWQIGSRTLSVTLTTIVGKT